MCNPSRTAKLSTDLNEIVSLFCSSKVVSYMHCLQQEWHAPFVGRSSRWQVLVIRYYLTLKVMPLFLIMKMLATKIMRTKAVIIVNYKNQEINSQRARQKIKVDEQLRTPDRNFHMKHQYAAYKNNTLQYLHVCLCNFCCSRNFISCSMSQLYSLLYLVNELRKRSNNVYNTASLTVEIYL